MISLSQLVNLEITQAEVRKYDLRCNNLGKNVTFKYFYMDAHGMNSIEGKVILLITDPSCYKITFY